MHACGRISIDMCKILLGSSTLSNTGLILGMTSTLLLFKNLLENDFIPVFNFL